MPAFDTHDGCLASLPADQRAALEALPAQIHAAAPAAREVFACGIPAVRIGPGTGKVLVGCAAMKAHCGLYLFEGDPVGRFADRLADFSIAKGPVRFARDHPLPAALVAGIVVTRLAGIG